MMNNPIVDEVRRIREHMLTEFGGDLHALARDLQRKTEKAGAGGKIVIARPPRSAQANFPIKRIASS